MTDPNVPVTPPAPAPAAPYAAAAPAAPYAAAAPAGRPTNVLAIIALIAAFLFPLAGIVCGHIALGQIKRTGEAGHGLALWGTILGYVFTGIYVLIIGISIITSIMFAGAVSNLPYGY